MKGLFTILLMLSLISGMISPVYAPSPGTMYGVEGRGSAGTAGGLNIVDQTDGSLTFVGDVVTPEGLSGLAIDSTVTAFGSTVAGVGPASDLVIINLDTGNLVSTVGTLTDVSGQELKIGDLAVQPGTDVLYGVSANSGPPGSPVGGTLFTIDKSTAIATLVGNTGAGVSGGLGFAPDGTLYFVSVNSGNLDTLDPSNANVLTTIAITPFFNLDGLGVRSDGTIFASESFLDDPFSIVTIDPDTGNVTILGDNNAKISDLDFIPGLRQSVGGEYFTLDTTALLLAGAQSFSWMIPVVLSVLGIGLFAVSRKSE